MEDVDLGDGNCISIRQEDWAAFEFHYSAWQIEKVDNARVTVINPDNWGLFATSDIGAGAIVGPCTPISWAKKAATLDSGTAMLLWENDWLKGMKQNKRGHLDVLADICDLCPRLLDFRERPPAEFRSHLRKKFTQNAFEYVDNVLVLYKTLSYANHSCWPNMQFSVPAAGSHDALRANQAGWFTALRNIRAGEEITINYKEDIVDLVERRKILYRVYGFHCACTVCKEQFCPSCGKTFEQQDAHAALKILEAEEEVFEEMGYEHKTDEDTEMWVGKTKKWVKSQADCDLRDCIYEADMDEFEKKVAAALDMTPDDYLTKRDSLFEE